MGVMVSHRARLESHRGAAVTGPPSEKAGGCAVNPQPSAALSEPLRIAVVGAGLIGRRHIDCILKNPGCSLAAVVDSSEAAQGSAEAAGVPFFRTLEALLSRDLPDGVVLATPNKLHVEQGIACLEAGVDTLIEKPVANTTEDGSRLIEAQRKSSATILVGHHRVHSPIMRQAREIIQSGTLGDLVAVTGHAMFYKPDDYFRAAPWRTKAGGGPILINMIHEVHNLRMLCGEIASVQAISSSKTRGFPVEDTVAIGLRFSSGVLGTFLLSDTAASARSWEQTALENTSYAAYPEEDCYHVAGTRGSLDIPTMRLRTYREERSWWKPFELSQVSLERRDPLVVQLEHFCEVVRGEVQPLVSLHDGLQNLRVIEAIVDAATAGGVVDVGSQG